MVVPASDFPGAPGAVPGSQPGMGAGVTPEMPTAPGQSVPPVDGGGVPGAAPPATTAPIDVQTIDPSIAQYLESHYRSGYVPESDLNNLRSTLDKQVAEAAQQAEFERTRSEGYRAQVAEAGRQLNAYISSILDGSRQPHPNDAASFILAIQNAGGQVMGERASAQSFLRRWEVEHESGLRSHIEQKALGGNGLPPVPAAAIANDAEVQRLDRELREAARLDAREGQQNPAHRQRVYDTTQALQNRIDYVAQVERLKLAQAPASAEAEMVQQNLARQDARGVQTAAVLGAGALSGAYDEQAAWNNERAKVAAKYGIDPGAAEASHWEEIYGAWVPGFDAANQTIARR